MWIRIDVDQDAEAAVLVGVVRTVGFPGDRSDYHDLISLLWAAFLRSCSFASVRLLDIPHPVCEGELYGRYLVFEKQPPATYVSLEKPNYEMIERLLVASCLAARIFSLLYQASDGDPDRESCAGQGGEGWAEAVTRNLKWKAGHRDELTNQRQNPNWCYYRRNDHGVTAFTLSLNLLEILAGKTADLDEVVLDGDGRYLVKTGDLKNTIEKKAVGTLFRLLGAYAVKGEGVLKALRHGESVLFLPTDSHLICVTERGIMAIESEGDYRTFREAEALLRERHQKEAKILHSSIHFCWKERIDDGRFEELALDLLNREPGVRWVRRVGAARASDGGRDLIAEWLQPPADWESATESQALVCRQVVIQCKAYSSSVNKTAVGDVPGTVDLHDANGYLLIAYPRITPPLVDYLRKVPAKREIWADWWTQSEIEDRLRRNMDIAQRYPDVISIAAESSD